MLINGCQEGKATPRLVEVKCPNCGECIEVFVLMGGPSVKREPLPVTRSVPAAMFCLQAVTKQIMNNKQCALQILQRTFFNYPLRSLLIFSAFDLITQ